MTDTATFRATLPPIMSSIRISGDGGMRVMFDVPESDMAEALKLVMWKQRVLVVTVGPEEAERERDEWAFDGIA
jgi:hypothetical protein